MENRPQSREENVNKEKSAGIKRRGAGTGKGPVGNQNRTEQFIKEHYQKEASKEENHSSQPRPAASKPPAAAKQAPASKPVQHAAQKPSGTAQKGPSGAAQDKGLVGDLLGGVIENAINNSGSANSAGSSPLGGIFGADSQPSGNNLNFGGNGNAGGGNTGGGNIGGGNYGSGNSGGGNSGGGRKKSSFLTIIIAIIVIILVIVLLRSCMCGGSQQQTSNTSSNSFAPQPTTQAATQATTATNSFANNATGNADNYGLSALLGGYDYDDYYDNYNYSNYSGNSYDYSDYSGGNYGSDGFDISSIFGGLSSGNSSYGNYFGGASSAKWDANTGTLNTAVVKGSRDKMTQLVGNGNDTVTLMIYICGSDLESSGGAATMDIQEMLNASASKNLNILLYTGGTRQWQNNVMSSSRNQIYQIYDGQLYRLETDAGNSALTDPKTLTSFIKYCAQNYPANRNMLVLWDHGGGSVAGYAYDENYKQKGYMSLAGINTALKNAGVKFDIIGFDTCLMATVENALMLSNYADYLVASEEVEPGTGWYYTDWLSMLAKNTSVSSLELGKSIIDSFITRSASSAYGVGCTLSLIDLAELSYTVPDRLAAFSDDISDMADSASSAGNYSTIIQARTSSREFGETQSLDQVDLVNFANNIGTDSAKELAAALKSAVKYNLVSNSMSYAYGVSVFFPYKHANYVRNAEQIYNEIGLTDRYTRCIKKVANLTGNGQSIYGYGGSSSSGFGSLLDALQGGNSYSSDSYSSSDISGLFSDLFFGRTMSPEDPECRFLADNHFDASQLVWITGPDGRPVISLPEDQWNLVTAITLNGYYDDGEGYYELGSDNYFELDDDGNLVGNYNGSWLSIDGQLVAYYYDSMTLDENNYSIQGHVPVMYNGERADLIIIFDSSNPKGYIAGVNTAYDEDGVVMSSKTWTHLREGDAIDFLADYYTYDGKYDGNYMIGDQWSYTDGAVIENIMVEGDVLAVYDFTDIYDNHYSTPRIPSEN